MKKPANHQPLLGSHVSTSGGCDKAIDRALSIGSTTMQIFVKNNMQWFAKPLTTKEADVFTKHPRRSELRSVFGHSGYLINPAAANSETLEKSLRSLREELIRADQLSLPFLVLHPGAHTGAGDHGSAGAGAGCSEAPRNRPSSHLSSHRTPAFARGFAPATRRAQVISALGQFGS